MIPTTIPQLLQIHTKKMFYKLGMISLNATVSSLSEFAGHASPSKDIYGPLKEANSSSVQTII